MGGLRGWTVAVVLKHPNRTFNWTDDHTCKAVLFRKAHLHITAFECRGMLIFGCHRHLSKTHFTASAPCVAVASWRHTCLQRKMVCDCVVVRGNGSEVTEAHCDVNVVLSQEGVRTTKCILTLDWQHQISWPIMGVGPVTLHGAGAAQSLQALICWRSVLRHFLDKTCFLGGWSGAWNDRVFPLTPSVPDASMSRVVNQITTRCPYIC